MYAGLAVVGALVLATAIAGGTVAERAVAQTATPTATVTVTPTPDPPRAPPPPLFTPTVSPIAGCPAVVGGVAPAPPPSTNQITVLLVPSDVLRLVNTGRPDALQFFYFIDVPPTPAGEVVPEGGAAIVGSRSASLDLSGRPLGTYRVSVVLARADRVVCYGFGGVRIAVGQGAPPTPTATPVVGPGGVRPLPPATGGGAEPGREGAPAAALGVLLVVLAAALVRRTTAPGEQRDAQRSR